MNKYSELLIITDELYRISNKMREEMYNYNNEYQDEDIIKDAFNLDAELENLFGLLADKLPKGTPIATIADDEVKVLKYFEKD